MTSKWLKALPVCAAGALVLCGVAGAANSQTFTDDTGDTLLAPDITQLDVSNDDTGLITVRFTLADGATIGAGEEVAAVFDVDQNPDTGTVYYGSEVALRFNEGMVGFARAAGNGFAPAPAPASLQATSGPGFVTFTISAADLGVAPTSGFNIAAVSETPLDGDLAPDNHTFNYQLVEGTPSPPLGPDTRAPVDRALPSRGMHGKVAELNYSAQDGRALTADTLRVYRRNRLIKTVRVRLGDASPFYVFYARWRIPRRIHGRLRFCVRSTDAAGNRSNLSCARLQVR